MRTGRPRTADRAKIIKYIEGGMTYRATAKALGVGEATVIRTMKEHRCKGVLPVGRAL